MFSYSNAALALLSFAIATNSNIVTAQPPQLPPQNDPTCPTTPGDSCPVPSTVCNYDFVRCPNGANLFMVTCECDDEGKFNCHNLSACQATSTDFPSVAPSEAPVAPVAPVASPVTAAGAREADPVVVPAAGLPFVYEEPAWWATVVAQAASTDEGSKTNLMRCIKRPFPPTEGSMCATRTKICYFGNQQCASSSASAYPETKCTCNGSDNAPGTWHCEAAVCPI